MNLLVENGNRLQPMRNRPIKTIVIAGFPGVGKSHYHSCPEFTSLDSDSSQFSKEKDFPDNYIKHIKDHIGTVDVIFVSTHAVVREALVKNKIEFTLVYPDRSLKQEFSDRFIWRRNTKTFIELLNDNWDRWIDEMEAQESCEKIILQSSEYLSDKISPIPIK